MSEEWPAIGSLLSAARVDTQSATGAGFIAGFGGESAFRTLSALQSAGSLPGRERWLAAELNHFVMLSEQVIRAPLEIVDGSLKLPQPCSAAELVDCWERVERLSQAA